MKELKITHLPPGMLGPYATKLDELVNGFIYHQQEIEKLNKKIKKLLKK